MTVIVNKNDTWMEYFIEMITSQYNATILRIGHSLQWVLNHFIGPEFR